MSRTKRVYNSPNKLFHVYERVVGWVEYWHPWKEIWCSGYINKKHKRHKHKQMRANDLYNLKLELKNYE